MVKLQCKFDVETCKDCSSQDDLECLWAICEPQYKNGASSLPLSDRLFVQWGFLSGHV